MNVSLPGGKSSLCANLSDTDLALGLTEAQLDDVNALLGTKANQSDFFWIMRVYYSTNKPGSSNPNAPSTIKLYIPLAAVCLSLFLAY